MSEHKTVLRYGAEVPEGFQTCNAMRGRDVQVNHLVRWVNRGTPGRTVLCGLTRFDSAPGARDADLPGWSMGGGLFGPGIRQEACAACWEAAKRTPNEGDAKGWESSHSSPGRGHVLASGDGSEGRSLLPDHDGTGRGLVAADQPKPTLQLVVVDWQTARGFCKTWHRHHKRPPAGHIFRTGVAAGELLVGVAIAGRPVSFVFDDGRTVEVNRTVTDGYPNANSMLYGAVARAAFAMGYRRVITYTQRDESGASLRAAGYRVVAERPARAGWNSPSRPRDDHGVDHMPRTLWEAS